MVEIYGNPLNRLLVMIQQSWKIWSNFMCPLGPFSLAWSQMLYYIDPKVAKLRMPYL